MTKRSFWHLTNPQLNLEKAPLLHLMLESVSEDAIQLSSSQYLEVMKGMKSVPKGWGVSVKVIIPGLCPSVYMANHIIAPAELADRIASVLPNCIQSLPIISDSSEYTNKRAIYVCNLVDAIDQEKADILVFEPERDIIVAAAPIPLEYEKVPASPACFVLYGNGYTVVDVEARELMISCGMPSEMFSAWEFQTVDGE